MTKRALWRWGKAALLLLLVAAIWIVLYIPFLAVPFGLAYFAWLYYRWHVLRSYGIVKRDNRLVQTDRAGKEVASIDLGKPYKVDVSFKSYLKPIYTIRQEQIKVQFTSDTKNAKYVAVDVLRVTTEWPPVGPWNFGW